MFGSHISITIRDIVSHPATVAQLVEQLIRNQYPKSHKIENTQGVFFCPEIAVCSCSISEHYIPHQSKTLYKDNREAGKV